MTHLHINASNTLLSLSGLETTLKLHPHVRLFSLLSRCVFALLSPQVDKVCGLSMGEPKGMQPTSPEVTTSAITSSTPLPSAAPSQLLLEQNLRQFARIRG